MPLMARVRVNGDPIRIGENLVSLVTRPNRGELYLRIDGPDDVDFHPLATDERNSADEPQPK